MLAVRGLCAASVLAYFMNGCGTALARLQHSDCACPLRHKYFASVRSTAVVLNCAIKYEGQVSVASNLV